MHKYFHMIIPADSKRGYRFVSLNQAESYIRERYPEQDYNQTLSKEQDKKIQRSLLLSLINNQNELDYVLNQSDEALCLRCRISHEILKGAQELWRRYGNNTKRPFSFQSISPLVLTDDGSPLNLSFLEDNQYRQDFFHGIQVLRECLIKKKDSVNLAIIMVKQSPVVESFLLEHGIYPYRDWAILNGTSQTRLQNTLRELFYVTESKIEEFRQILDIYHRVYRKGRRGKYSRCVPPSRDTELPQMITYLQKTYQLILDSDSLIEQLRIMANYLRQAIIGSHNPDLFFNISGLDEEYLESRETDNNEYEEMIENFRQQINVFLDELITNKFTEAINSFSSRLSIIANNFEFASSLLICEGLSQQNTAQAIGISQPQVNRHIVPKLRSLLKQCREQLKERIIELIRGNTLIDDPNRVDDLDEIIVLVGNFLEQSNVFPPERDFLKYNHNCSQEEDTYLFVQRVRNYLVQANRQGN